MTDVHVRDMTPEDEAFVGSCARADAADEAQACAARRVQWLRRVEAHGGRTKVAVRDGRPLGFLYALPIERAPWGPLGEDLLVIPCLFVGPEETGHGVGRALVAAAEEEAVRQGRKGLVTTAQNHEAWFMPVPFFEELGYRTIERRGLEVILFKPLAPDARPPRLLVPRYRFRRVPRKVVVDLFFNDFCLTSAVEADHVRAAVRAFGDRIHLNEHDASDPAVLRASQIPRGIFVQGTRLTWGYAAPREALEESLASALAELDAVR